MPKPPTVPPPLPPAEIEDPPKLDREVLFALLDVKFTEQHGFENRLGLAYGTFLLQEELQPKVREIWKEALKRGGRFHDPVGRPLRELMRPRQYYKKDLSALNLRSHLFGNSTDPVDYGKHRSAEQN